MKTVQIMCAAVLCGQLSWASEKMVNWSLPANWTQGVSVSQSAGYSVISGESLVPRGGFDAAGNPDLPYLRVDLDMPQPGTFRGISYEVEWTALEGADAKPMPIADPVPVGERLVLPPLGASYGAVYPAVHAEAQGLIRVDGALKVPVIVTPFRWDGAAQRLYRATKLSVTARFDVPDAAARTRSRALARAVATAPTADYGDDQTADYLIVSPPKFVDLWKKFADFRKTTEVGKSHLFAVKSTAAIYEEFKDVAGDDALRIHRYLERIYAQGKIKYILLGAAPVKGGTQYNRETMIPSRYVVVGSSSGAQVLDQYYGSMERLPYDSSGNQTGAEVWDWDGDGVYLGTRNANGSYSYDAHNNVDWTMDIAVSRFPLMEQVVETTGTGANKQTLVLTAVDIIDNFIAKIRRFESPDFEGRFGACLAGSQGHRVSNFSVPDRNENLGLVTNERSFFDGALNVFDYRRGGWASDSEFVPRDRNWESLTYLRGNNDDLVVVKNDSNSKNTYADIYRGNGDVLNILAHGWARGCSPGSATDLFFSGTGLYGVYSCPIPCDSGMMDYCPDRSFGITNAVCFGEAAVLSPRGGAIASFSNTRLGGSATYATSDNNGGGNYSLRMDWLLFRALSGRASADGQPMDAGTALKYAKNNYGWSNANAAQHLMGCQVTGQGDPLVRVTPQFSRVWNAAATDTRWSHDAANWTVPGQAQAVGADYSTDLTVDLTGKGSVSFSISDNLASAGLFVTQDSDATLTLTGDAKYRVTREVVVTGGNLRWEAAGGAGRNGLRFVGARGAVTLPGDRPRYFGDRFTNVGDIRVTGGNVIIDTPRNGEHGTGNLVDFAQLSFVGDDRVSATNNVLRTREYGMFADDYVVPVTRSELVLEARDTPSLNATEARLVVRPNPLWQPTTFHLPVTLADAELEGAYAKCEFGTTGGDGFDLTVSGASRLTGETPIRVNDELRVRFADESAELTIENALTDGDLAGCLKLVGAGTLKLASPLALSTDLAVGAGQTLVCAAEETLRTSVTVEAGGKLKLDAIPVVGLKNLTVKSGAALYLPAPSQKGIYKVVDATTTQLVLEPGAEVYDENGARVTGELTQGYYVLSTSQFVWKAPTDGVWNLSDANLTAWMSPAGQDAAYVDNSLVKFGNLDGFDAVTVRVGAAVAPSFVLFENSATRYAFVAETGADSRLSVDSLAVSTPVRFEIPVRVPSGIMATGSDATFGDVSASTLEIADGATVRVTGSADLASNKIRKLRFEFATTQSASERAAISELRLFTEGGSRFFLPVGTVIRDCAGAEVVVAEGRQGSEGQPVTGNAQSVGNECLSALVDGTLANRNKWWASQSAAPTWFEITFPEPVSGLSAYQLMTADHSPRDPKDWQVFAGADDDRLDLVASETGHSGSGRYAWIAKDGSDRLPLSVAPTGSALVRTGGTLVLDGSWCADLTVQADAVLKVVGASAYRATGGQLVLPESGTVKVDLSEATRTATAFPVLTGYGLTADDFRRFASTTDAAALMLRDGDLYAATDNVLEPPYRAEIRGDAKWSELTFEDKNGVEFAWNSANVKASGTVTLDVRANATLTLDAVGTAACLALEGSGALTVVSAPDAPWFSPALLDDSTHLGALVWNGPVGSAEVRAGVSTTLNGGEEATGLLSVGADKRVTLGDGVTFTRHEIDPRGHVRFAGERKDFVLSDWPAARYSFEDGYLEGDFKLPNHTLVSADGDSVRLLGRENVDLYTSSLLNYEISGGLVEILPNGVSVRFGRSGSSPTRFVMTGGTFRCKVAGTGSGDGLLVAYEGEDQPGQELTLDISGGVFEVPEAWLNFGTAVRVALSGEGVLRAKGFSASLASAQLVLGESKSGAMPRLEIGSAGYAASAGELTVSGRAALVGFEPGAVLSGAVRLDDAAQLTLGAAEGAELRLENVPWTMPESCAVSLGSSALTGEVRFGDAVSMPSVWSLLGGTANLGANRATGASRLASRPTAGRVVVELGYDEYAANATFPLLTCGAWAEGLESAELRSVIAVKRDEKGVFNEVKTGILACENGVVVFSKAESSSRMTALRATVTGDADWSSLNWVDAKGLAYAGDWSDVASAELALPSGEATVTMDAAVLLPRLTTVVSAGAALKLASDGARQLTVTEWLNDADSEGSTSLDLVLGADVAVDSGRALSVRGAESADTPHGVLKIGASDAVTVRDGLWNGAVEMADATGRLTYAGSRVLGLVPQAQAPTVGTLAYAVPIRTQTAVFGSADESRADGTFAFESGANLEVTRLVTGAGKGTQQKFVHGVGASVTVTGSGTDALVLARDAGSDVTYVLNGGTFVSTGAPLVLGGAGTARLQISGRGTYRFKGITTNGEKGASSLSFSGDDQTVLELGADGLDLGSSTANPFVWNGGTIRTTADAAIRVPQGISTSEACYLAPDANTTLAVSAPFRNSGGVNLFVSGSGRVKLETDLPASGSLTLKGGTLCLPRLGMVPDGMGVRYNADGSVEVALTRAEAETSGAKYKLFKVLLPARESTIKSATRVVYADSGEPVEGEVTYESQCVYFAPKVTPVETVATKLACRLPGSETVQEFVYVYHPLGTDDGRWETASNWASAEVVRREGVLSTNYTAFAGATAPALKGGTYVPILFDGPCRVTASTGVVEGWVAQYGLFHGAEVTIGQLAKFQRGGQSVQMLVAVDATSRLTISNWAPSGNSDANINFHVAAPSGIVFNVAYNRPTVVNYYLEGNGSVAYAKGFSGTHKLQRAEIDLGDASLPDRAVRRKYLVLGTGTLDSGAARVEGGVSRANAVSEADAVGTYAFGSDAVGTYVEWVAHAPAQGVFYTDPESGETYDITAAFTRGTDGAWVLDAKGSVTVRGETIPVQPVLATIAEDEHVAVAPFVVDGERAVLGVKSIPGLTYELLRGTQLGVWEDSPRAVKKAQGVRVKLMDPQPPAPRAFYLIRVSH